MTFIFKFVYPIAQYNQKSKLNVNEHLFILLYYLPNVEAETNMINRHPHRENVENI